MNDIVKACQEAGMEFERALGRFVNGQVLVAVKGSRLHKQAEPHILPACLSIKPKPGEMVKEEVEFAAPIGKSNCVKVTRMDEFVMAVRGKREYESRIVVGKKPEPTRKLSMIAVPVGNAGYALRTAYVGPLAPREPGDPAITDPKELHESKEFWNKHALTEDSVND